MSNVTLEIGGRSFTVACAQGEEDHVAALGHMIGAKLAEMEGIASQSEARMLLFASLLLADELHELRSAPPPAAPSPTSPADDGLPSRAEMLEVVADKLENLAARLEAALRNA